MRHKRLTLSAVLLLGAGLVGLQAQMMFVWENDGLKSTYTLLEIKKMDFSSGNIEVAIIGGYSNSYLLSDLRSLKFNEVTSMVQNPLTMQTTGNIRLFPNPVIDVMNLQLTSEVKSIGVIEIISMEGRIVFSQTVNRTSDVFQVNLSDLDRGLYVCKLSNGIAIETVRFVKQ